MSGKTRTLNTWKVLPWKFFLEFVVRFLLKTLPEGIHFLGKLRFKILEFYRVMYLHTFKNFDQKLSNSLWCAENKVGKLFWNTYDPSSSHGLNRCYILQLVLMGILWSTLEQKFKNSISAKFFIPTNFLAISLRSFYLNYFFLFCISEAVAQRRSVKEVFLKISQNSQENTFVGVSF